MNRHKIFGKLLLVILSITLIACSGGGSVPTPTATPSEEANGTVAINFVGMSRIEAEEWMNDVSFDHEKVYYTYVYSDTVPESQIMAQSIPVGQPIGDQTITLTVSNGVDPDGEVKLIDFSSLTTEQIQKWFANEKFQHVSVEYVYDDKVPAGEYVGTNLTGDTARRNQPVVIKISAGPRQTQEMVDMDNMIGWQKKDVEYWANMNTITVDYVMQRSASVPYGYVISQNPQGKTSIAKGSRVTVVISIGADVTAIDLTKMSRADIEKWGNDNGVQISWIQCWNSLPSGTIYANQPNTGTIRMGDIMRVYTSVGPIPVRDFTNQLYKANFLGWLNSINEQYNNSGNLKVNIQYQDTTEYKSDVIISQSPNAGYINPGETITLVVANAIKPTPTPTPTSTPAPTATPTPTPIPHINIPSMVGYAEFDFLHALHAYGVVEGDRLEQYSKIIAKDYIIWNATGDFEEGEEVDYIVSLGEFTIDPAYWYARLYSDLESVIDTVQRAGADVYLDASPQDTTDPNMEGRILEIHEPEDDGMIYVKVGRFVTTPIAEDVPEEQLVEPAPAEEPAVVEEPAELDQGGALDGTQEETGGLLGREVSANTGIFGFLKNLFHIDELLALLRRPN